MQPLPRRALGELLELDGGRGSPAVAGVELRSGVDLEITVALNFTNSSIDFRDPAAKVGFSLPGGKVFDPDAPVSRLPQ